MNFVVGLVVGACIGFMAAAMCKTSKEHSGDKCCYFCMAASECQHSCKSNPGECGKAVKLQ